MATEWRERFAELGLEVPPVVKPVAAYVPATRTGTLVYTSGQLPIVDGELKYAGKVGAEITVDEAKAAAEHADHVTGWDYYLPRLPVYAATLGARA